MKSTIKRWGNSLAVRLPRDLARSLELAEGSTVTLEVVQEGLLVKRARARSLDELLEGVTRDTIHGEVDWGEAVGKEAW